MTGGDVPVVTDLGLAAYTVPTDEPEADGTLAWSSTTMVVARPSAGGHTGLGYSYTAGAAATLARELLADVVEGSDALDVAGTWGRMVDAIRNVGRPGVASTAIAAVDIALWDLKAKLLDLPLVDLLGPVHEVAPIYGSGGFTSYSDERLCEQLGGWVLRDGIGQVKMKIGTDRGTRERRDLARVAAARRAVGPDAGLFVDANGAYDAKQARRLAAALAAEGVTWFEEPVSSDDLDGLRAVRDATAIDVTAGEYGYDLAYFERMCRAAAVDVLQVDVTRCAGITEWRRAAAVAAAHGLDVSGHCAPGAHLHVACATPNLRHLEYFHDHTRIERLLFDGSVDPEGGALRPDRDRPGLGLALKDADADRYRRC